MLHSVQLYLQTSNLTNKNYTRLKKRIRVKRSSLLCHGSCDEKNRFIRLTPEINVIQRFFSVNDGDTN